MDKTNEPDLHEETAPDLRKELVSHAQQLAAFSTELEMQRNQLRDYEKALVERIADVDDDRRSTATKLQRAWRTQGEQMDDRLRRQAMYATGSLILLAVVLLGAMFLVYRQSGIDRQSVEDNLSEIRSEMGAAAKTETVEALVDGRLAGLSSMVDEVSASVNEFTEDKKRAEQAAREGANASAQAPVSQLVGEIQDLKAEQEELARQLESLGARAREQGESVRKPLDQERASREAAVNRLTVEIDRLENKQQRLVEDIQSLRDALGAAGATAAAAGPTPDQAGDDQDLAAAADAKAEVSETGARPETAPAISASASDSLTVATPVADQTAAADEAAPADPDTAAAPDRIYALQLIGFYSIDSLNRFAARGDLGTDSGYLEERFRGRPWFVVIHSLHDDYASAKAALSGLPEDIRSLGPWIRPMAADTELRALDPSSGDTPPPPGSD